MPVDNSKPAPTRRSSRKVVEDEDLELKRIRGEISCAECRRLKLRCDKKVPCGSCVRRGCSSICPNGSLSSGQGTRFILADTDHLHRKIAEMSQRIRQLEDALAIFQASLSSERHPLLADELLKIKFGPEAFDAPRSPAIEETVSQSIDALGTLTLGDSGEVKYFGRSAGTETLLLAGEESDYPSTDEEDDLPPVPPEIARLGNLFPFTAKGALVGNTLGMLESFLPSQERAWALCECFLDHASWYFRPFDRDELVNDLLTPIYKTAQARASHNPQAVYPSDHHPHRMAALFFVFGVGALVDLTLPPYNAEAHRYYDLGRATLSLRSVYDSPQVETVQAVALMANYHSLAGKNYSRDGAWLLMSLAAKLAQSIGLHRDSSRWNLDARTVQRRRALFWEIFTSDTSVSLALGRPPSFNLSCVDCEFPTDEEIALNESGEKQAGFWWWKHTFAKEIFSPVAKATVTAKAPSYASMLDLDRKVRQMAFPTSFKPYAKPGDRDYNSASVSIRSFYLSQHRTITMLYIHRSFFAQAMLDHPANPLRSPFAPSFLAAYRCASIIIKAFVHQFERAPELTMRIWFLINHAFSAAVVVGSVVSRAPNSNMAPSALVELGVAVDVFEKMAHHSSRARIALSVLRKLRDKASKSYAQFRAGTSPPPANIGAKTDDGQDDELAIFGGQARIISSRSLSRKPTASGSTSNPQWQNSPSPPSSSASESRSSSSANANSVVDIHPSLMEYLDVLPGTSSPANPGPNFDASILPYSWLGPLESFDASLGTQLLSAPLPEPSSIPHEFISTANVPSTDNLPSSFTMPSEVAANPDFLDLGLSSESGMDEQWLSFMRSCGILDSNMDGVTTG